MTLPVNGSKWTGGDSIKFYVLDIRQNDQGTWVYYQRSTDGAEFHCLLEAFLSRFKEDKSYTR